MTAGLWTQQSLFGQQEPPEALLCWLWLAHTLGPASAHAGRLLAWCGEQGLRVCSDSYEFCINDYLTTHDESEYITKIAFYVKEQA